MKKIYQLLFVVACFIVYSKSLNAQVATTQGQKANDQLSNLVAPTAINVDLLPNADGIINLGSPALNWNYLYLKNFRLANGSHGAGKIFTSDANGVAGWKALVAGTSGTDFSINYDGTNHTFNLPSASAVNRGLLTPIDWSIFNNKQDALNGTGFVKIAGTTISYDNSSYTPTSRTLTINGITHDLSDNRSWTISGTGLNLIPIGSSPNSNGATVTATTLNLQPANQSFGGVVTTGTQTFAGAKTFLNDAIINGLTVGKGGGNVFGNTAIGTIALYNNTTGFQNTAIGNGALQSNTTGNYNTASGSLALLRNTSGFFNTATGNNALSNNTTGFFNTSVGTSSLYSNTTGNNNTAIGLSSLYYNTTGNLNTASGAYALFANTTGNQNIAIGYNALGSNTEGFNNTSSGFSSMALNTIGANNVAYGSSALRSNIGGAQNTAIGTSALYSSNSINNSAIGFFSLYSNTSGSHNSAIGAYSLYLNTTGSFNTANGAIALQSNTTGEQNVANGFSALYSNTTGNLNTATGYYALQSNTIGAGNTATGNRALQQNTIGIWNQADGTWALISNTTGEGNSANGALTLYSNATGSFNNANGYYTLNSNTTGNGNTGTGSYALSANTIGTNNTALGLGSLGFNFTGNNNTAVGSQANVSSIALNNASAIGADAIVSASNSVRIGNTAVTSIGGEVGWSTLSDGRYKRNIKNNVPGLEFINQLEPVTYTLNVEGIDNKLHKNQNKIQTDSKETNLKFSVEENVEMKKAKAEKSKIVYTGFVAQDVEKVAAKIGYDFSGVDKPKDDKESFYGLRYAEFVVPLVKAVQELAQQNESLKATNTELNDRLNKIEAALGISKSGAVSELPITSTSITLSSARLDQNIPNPANQSVLINYYIPENAGSAEMQITGIKGEIIKRVVLPAKGNGQLKLQTVLLNSGAYTYSLIIDGSIVDTKKMLLAR